MIISDLEAADRVHRVHDGILPVFAWSVFTGIVIQFGKPRKSVAPLLMVLAFPLIYIVVELATGSLTVASHTPWVPLVLVAMLRPQADPHPKV